MAPGVSLSIPDVALYRRGSGGGPVTAAFDPSNTDTAHITLSGGNLIGTGSGLANSLWGTTRGTLGNTAGKFYSEYTITDDGSGGVVLGAVLGTSLLTNNFVGESSGIGCQADGAVFQNNVFVTAIASYANGSNVGVAVDIGNQLIWWRVNGGNWNNSGTANPATGAGGISFTATGTIYPAASIYNGDVGEVVAANFGATAYAHTAPSGFVNWVAGSGSPAALKFDFSSPSAEPWVFG